MTIEVLPEDARRLCEERFGLDRWEEWGEEGPVLPRERVVELARALKEELGFLFFVTCAATHYPEEGEPGSEDHRPDRVVVSYRVRRLPAGGRPGADFPFRVVVPTGQTTPSLAGTWVGADWQEREQYDLVGVVFEGHPDLRRIMLPEDWEGHPLRRDYAIETPHYPWR